MTIYLAVIFAPSIWDAFQFISAKAAVGFIFLAFFWHFKGVFDSAADS
jgi:hypothetical protein